MEAKWNIAPEPNPEKVTALSLALGIDRVLVAAAESLEVLDASDAWLHE